MLDATGRDLLSPSPDILAPHSKSVNDIQEMSCKESQLSHHPHSSSPPLTLPLRSSSPSCLPSSQSKRITHQSTQTSPSLSSSTRGVRSRADHRISLNVGGKVYETTTETLLSVRGSYFTALLSSLWSDSTEEDEDEDEELQDEVAEEVHEPHGDEGEGQGRRRRIRRKRREKGRKEIFVDRNGERFSYILDYLRDGVLVCPLEKSLLQGLLLEAKFFGLPSMVSDIQTSLDFIQRQQACRAIQYASERYKTTTAESHFLSLEMGISISSSSTGIPIYMSGHVCVWIYSDGEVSLIDVRRYTRV